MPLTLPAWPARLVALALSVLLVHLVAASGAFAHAGLRDSNPREGSTLAAAPDHVSLLFDELMSQPSSITVLAPDGSSISTGEPYIDQNVVGQAVTDPGQAGSYTVNYSVTSTDAHTIEGSFLFTVSSGESVDSGAGSGRVWIVVALAPAVVLALFVLVQQVRRRASAG